MNNAPATGVGPAPPVDPTLAGPLRRILDQLSTVPLTPELIAYDRQLKEAHALSDEQIRRDGAFTLEERAVPGPAGAPDIFLLICRPTTVDPPYPVIFHIHGGGMVSGHNRTSELVGDLDRAQELGLAVVAVNYRLAPEHPDPAPVEDCYAGLVWLAENAASLGFDRDRIVVSGVSAGGGLAAGTALLARDRSGPPLLGQMLLCPMLDDRCDTPSAVQMHSVGLWDTRSNLTGWSALLGTRRGTGQVSPYAAPARESNLADLPPAYIDVGSVEALRDEAVAYASRIWQAGGQAELHVWSGAFHCFDEWVPHAEVSQAALRMRLSWLRRLLESAD